MTAPANNDAAQVREALFCPVHRQRDCSPLLNGCSRVNHAADALARLAATAERADELTARNQFLSTEQVRADTAEAALLAAQQTATRWQNRATLLGQERQRAEATNTRLREALEQIASDIHPARPDDEERPRWLDENSVWWDFLSPQEIARRALAQDAEQETHSFGLTGKRGGGDDAPIAEFRLTESGGLLPRDAEQANA